MTAEERPESRSVGRPSLYKPEYCGLVRDLGRQGKSKAQIAAEIGVSRRVIDDWKHAHSEFLLALEDATDFALAWWENTGMAGLAHGVMNASVWSRSMAARFPADYREEHRTELVGPGGGPILHKSADDLTDEELAAIAARGRPAPSEQTESTD